MLIRRTPDDFAKDMAQLRSKDNMNPILVEHAKAIHKLGKQTFNSVVEIGRRLVECRTILKEDGEWNAWLKSEFDWSYQTAKNFINVYELSKSNEQNFSRLDLPLSALYLLAAPSTSKETRDEVVVRARRGEKVKHKEVADMVRKTKKAKPPTGLRADIIAAVKAAGNDGMTTDQLKVLLSQYDPQTVNSTTNTLAQKDILRDSGVKRKTRADGGRPAIVYVFNPEPQPTKKKSSNKSSSKVVDLNHHRIFTMIEDGSLWKVFAKWAVGKTDQQRVAAAYQAIIPLVGSSRGGLLKIRDLIKVADEQFRVAKAEGRVLEIDLNWKL